MNYRKPGFKYNTENQTGSFKKGLSGLRYFEGRNA